MADKSFHRRLFRALASALLFGAFLSFARHHRLLMEKHRSHQDALLEREVAR